jgi:hypothetical protein
MDTDTKENSEDFSRDSAGRFKLGTRGGPGSPVAKHARLLHQRLTEALHTVCDRTRLVTVIDQILRQAEAGDVQAAKLIFERIAPADLVTEERLAELEKLFEAKAGELD